MHKVGRWQNFNFVNERKKFHDFTTKATLPDVCWQALKNNCVMYMIMVEYLNQKNMKVYISRLPMNVVISTFFPSLVL